MLALAAGTDKCFWFYDYDAPEPKQFFDGCGLFAADSSPKLALCSLAAMTSLLPNPEYVGSIIGRHRYDRLRVSTTATNWWPLCGPSTRTTDRRSAFGRGNCATGWAIACRDLSAKLSLAPVYAVGLDPADVWSRQTAYELATPALLPVTAGDPVTPVVEIRNQRKTPLDCTLRLSVPTGWKAAADRVHRARARPARAKKSVCRSKCH